MTKQFSPLTALGIMSGTSLDALDLALLKTNGSDYNEPLHSSTYPFPNDLKDELLAFQLSLPAPPFDTETQTNMKKIEKKYSQFVIESVQDFLSSGQYSPDYIGWHGQTVAHAPDIRWTCQLADAHALAQAVNIKVIYDFRTADVEAGGQGAPFAPVYHGAIANMKKLSSALFVNIGGIANVTYCGENEEDLIAFDCGVGNALMDDVMRGVDKYYDEGGKIARGGVAHHEILQKWLSHSYFIAPPPKSLHRQDFHEFLADIERGEGLSLADKLATLIELTVLTIVGSCDFLPQEPRVMILCGGGRHNDFLLERLAVHTSIELMLVDDLGFDGDMLEAQAFGYLAIRHVRGLALSYPMTTGVPVAMRGGRLASP